MKSAKILLGFSLLALLLHGSFGRPAKGSKPSDQSSSSFSPPRVQPQYAPYGGHSEPVHYASRPGSVPHTYMEAPGGVQFVQVAPDAGAGSGFSFAGPVTAYPVESGNPALFSASAAAVQAAVSSAPVLVVQGPAPLSAQQAAPQAQMPETQWTVRPSTFSEEEAPVALTLSEVLPPAPLPPAGPVLQSGETSNIVKEAELGNFQQQTEEFGYPAGPVQPGVTFTSVLPGLGGFPHWGAPYPGFDYRLLYGLYPPGTYTTFSQNHERGKDYHQSVHYLKEHVSEDQGPQQQQQQKVFPGRPQSQQFQ